VKLVLASGSFTRRRMLEAAAVPFEVELPHFDEEAIKRDLRTQDLAAVDLAAALAAAKALALQPAGSTLVLGADQTLERDDGTMLDKPESRQAGAAQLQSLRGRVHHLHAAAAIAERGRIVWSAVESVKLRMRPFSEAFLADYLEREFEAIRGGVGGYRIEGAGVQLFESIQGSHFAILGLPLLPLLSYLRDRGVMKS
jgi:septum formation protein